MGAIAARCYFLKQMINPIYIHGIGCISIQPTFETDYFFEEIKPYSQNPVSAMEPSYKTRIPPLQLRRMNKSMKMAIFASKLALEEAKLTHIDAVISGSGQGCLQDSERFVETLRADESQLMNPTPFIQSTHNMAAAAIALALGCKGYNMTYVNNANSFESAALDTLLYLQENPGKTVLLGGVDEVGIRSPLFWDIAGYLNRNNPSIPNLLVGDHATGEIAAEGATFFVASNRPTEHGYGKIIAVETRHQNTQAITFINQFLQRHHVSIETIDAVMMGYNGDIRYDRIYQEVGDTLFAKIPQMGFKHVLGENDTVISAGLAIALGVLKRQYIPASIRINASKPRSLVRILIYNQRRGEHHSLILVER